MKRYGEGAVVTGEQEMALLAHGHRTVGRIAAILEKAAAGHGDGVRLSTLAEELQAPKSSIHGLLRGLLAVGYLVEHQGSYTLGPAINTLLGGVEPPTLEQVARRPMEDLCDRFDETVMLGQRVGESIVYLAAVESRQPIRYSPALNQRRPVLPTSMGKVYVAELPGKELDSYLAAKVSDRSRRRALLKQLQQVRETGVGVNLNETLPGLCGVASGIRRQGKLVACIGMAGPSERLDPQLDEITRAVAETSARISAQLS